MPTLSLIIPTRERAGTLFYAIKSALADAASDFEVIVSDNASQDNTREVVGQFDDPRLRYINPGRRLSMTEHWEFALGESRGDYVTIIGDDDAVNQDALSSLLRAIDGTSAGVLHWQTHVYIWPSNGAPAHTPYLAPHVANPMRREMRPLVSNAFRWGIVNYARLPHLYHSAIHRRRVLDRIKTAIGSYFRTTLPDVWMSLAIPVHDQDFVSISPVTTNGHSPASNSGAIFAQGGDAKVLSTFFAEAANEPLHAHLPASVDPRVVRLLEPMLVAKDTFPDYYADIRPNISAMWAFAESVVAERLGFRVLDHQQAIRAADPSFSVAKYLAYASLYRAQKMRAMWHQKRTIVGTGAPADIFSFTQSMH